MQKNDWKFIRKYFQGLTPFGINVFLVSVMLLSGYFCHGQEQLVVFLQEGKKVSDDFKTNVLPEVVDFSGKSNIEVIVKDVLTEGAPTSITITPSIVFQNSLGRSLYQGRYSTTDRLINFIRTVRNEPKPNELNKKHDVYIWKNERATIAMPIKLTSLQGTIPDDYDDTEFLEKGINALGAQMKVSRLIHEIELPRNARSFYMDFHPWLSEEGTLHVSMAIFSMFDCVEPVFETSEPVKGQWSNRFDVLAKAGELLEDNVVEQLQNLTYGDAFEAIQESTITASWDSLGLSLPAKTKDALPEDISLNTIPKHWKYDRPLSNHSPIIQFQFGSPIDYYAGEAKEMNMQLDLASDTSLLGATGHVVVNPNSITMGDDGLDHHIYDGYLKVFTYPNATYNFKITKAPKFWKPNTTQPIELTGAFKMIGKAVDLKAKGTASLLMDSKGQLGLKIHGNFTLPLFALYGIEGPDGPSPARDILSFQLNFLMSAAQSTALLEDNLYQVTKPLKTVVAEEPIQNDYILWKARNRVYKAKGSFEQWKFTELKMKKNELTTLEAKVEIPISGLKEKSKLLVKHLKGPNFFDIEKHPIAQLHIYNVRNTEDNAFQADGEVLMKGVKSNISLDFVLVDENEMIIKGSTTVDRTKHGIGTSKKSKNISALISLDFQMNLLNHLNKK